MKKLHSLFILSILALTMFVGCQMPTEDVKDILTATYRVNVAENTYKDNVSVDKATPKAGDTVVITITVPDDFSADDLKLSVMKNNEAVTVTDEKSTETNKVKKSFTMPESDVTVTVNFEKKATPTEDTPTEDTDEATYGFTETVDYTVVANGKSLPETKTGAELIALAKEKNLIKDTDYTINGTTVTLTSSGVTKFFGNTGDGNTSSGGDTSTYTVSVPNGCYSGFSNISYNLAIQNSPSNGYKKGDQVEILITNGSYNVSTGIWGTPEGIYLVKVFIKEGETELTDIPVTVKDLKIQFTMPAKNIYVNAIIAEMTPRIEKNNGQKDGIQNKSKNTAHIVLFWDGKEFDNLTYNENYGKYVWDVGDLEAGDVLFITIPGFSEVGKPGMIVNNELIEIKPFFGYYWID